MPTLTMASHAGQPASPLPQPRQPIEPDWLTAVPESTGVRSVPFGTGAQVLPRVPAPVARRRGPALVAVAGVLAVVAGGGALVLTAPGRRVLAVAGVGSLARATSTAAAIGPASSQPAGPDTGTGGVRNAPPEVPAGAASPSSGALLADPPTAEPTEPATEPATEPTDLTGPSSEPTGPATPSAVGPTAGAPGRPQGAAAPQDVAALDRLRSLRTADLAGVALDGRWVALLASKYPGIRDPYQVNASGSHLFDATDILAQHLTLRQRDALGTRVILLLSTDYGSRSEVDGRALWVTLALGSFPSSAAVEAWCVARFPGVTGGELADTCLPRQLGTPIPVA